MVHRSVCAVLVVSGMALAPIAQGELPAMKSEPITASFRVPTEVVLWGAGGVRCAVLLPEAPAFAQAAREARDALQRLSEQTLPLLPEADYRSPPDGVSVLIAVGNFTTGPLVRRLYANHLVGADGFHPGEGGFELRVIPSAMDTGMDIVFLGASSAADIPLAVEELLAQIKARRTGAIPILKLWRPKGWTPPRTVSDEDIAKTIERAGKTLGSFRSSKVNQYRSVCHLFQVSARDFYLSGDDSYGRQCAALLHFLAEHYGEISHPPTFTLAELVIAIDQCEESGGLTDVDRVLAAEWLRQMVEDAMVFWELRGPVRRYHKGERRPIWNHQTYPALGVALAAQFLRAHYDVAAADYWAAVMENLFAGQINSPQPLEDSANYQWSVPHHTSRYVLSTGRQTEYFSNGVLRECLDYAIASHDAFGNEATHGDAWSTFGSVAAKLFRLGAALYADERCMWLLKLTDKSSGTGMWSYAPSCKASEPTDHVGLRRFLVDPLRADALGVKGAPGDRVLDKVVFRSGWGEDDDYMMLDGLHVGNHKHVDGNAIIRYSKGDHYWLVDMDYIRSEPRHHNSLAWLRNGICPDLRSASNRDAQVIASQPFAAELVCSAGNERTGLTWSRMNNCGGADWDRAIFWKAGDFFVVVDTVSERTEAADFRTRCFWRTLGHVSLEGNTVRVTQSERLAEKDDALVELDDAGRRVVEFAVPGAELKFPLRLVAGTFTVELVAKGTGGGSDSLWFQVDDREPVAHHIPLDTYGSGSSTWKKEDAGVDMALAETREYQCRISLREGPGPRLDRVVVRGEDGSEHVLEAEDLLAMQEENTTEADEKHFFIVNADGARMKVRECFDYGHGGRAGYYAAYRYAGKMTSVITQTKDRRIGKGESVSYANLCFPSDDGTRRRDIRPCGPGMWLILGEPPAVVGFGPRELPGGVVVPEGMFMVDRDDLVVAQNAKTAGLPPLSEEVVDRILAEARKRASELPGFMEAPTIAAPSLKARWELSADSKVTALASHDEDLLYGTKEGAVGLVREGKTLWQRKVDGKVRTLAFAKIVGQGTVCLVGTHPGKVLVLELQSGKELWRYECASFHGRTGSVATVFGADLDADGFDEVIAGSDNWHYHALSAEGKLLWRTDTTHAGIVGVSGDIDGDGRDEILAGTEYGWPRLLGPDGRLLQRLYGGPVTSAVAMIDTDADGRPEPYIALEDSYVRRVEVGKGFAWNTNCGGTVTSISALDVIGDSKPALACTTVAGTVCALSGAGDVLWRTLLPDSALCGVAHHSRLAVGCDDGNLYILTNDGTVNAIAQPGAVPTRVCFTRQGTLACAAGDRLVGYASPRKADE